MYPCLWAGCVKPLLSCITKSVFLSNFHHVWQLVICCHVFFSKYATRSSTRTQKMSQTPNRESPVQSDRKVTPRARSSNRSTPKSSHKVIHGKSADATAVTPRRSSAHVASPRRSSRSTPRTDHKKQKVLPARRLRSTSFPGTGRVLRPRTPKSYKFTAVDNHDDDLYQPDAESSDEEEVAMKETSMRQKETEVAKFC